MKTYLTSTGRTITAPSIERATELARQYSLGDVVGIVEAQAARRSRAVAQSYVLWDDLCQTVREEGALAQVAAAFAADPQDHYTILARGPRGLRALNAAERRQLEELVK